MLYTGITRSASGLLQEQTAELHANKSKRDSLTRMVKLCYELRDAIQLDCIDAFGEMLHEGWLLKKSLAANISNSAIDQSYEMARKHGAIGGKILGAGAGGFLLLYAPQEKHSAICQALPSLRRIPFAFERLGSRIILYHPN
jgi:D-glycero-alpha-D-manno-heptose-7-phosphate kinase